MCTKPRIGGSYLVRIPVSLLAGRRQPLGNRKRYRVFTTRFFDFCDFHSHCSATPYLRHRMTLNGFASKGLNKLAHALNGNHISWHVPTPHHRSTQWAGSFAIPNGMIVFDYAFYGKEKLWIRLIQIAPLPLDCTGHCYGRSPPAGAGREAAGHTSKNSGEYGMEIQTQSLLERYGFSGQSPRHLPMETFTLLGLRSRRHLR